MSGMQGFHVSASGAIQGHRGRLCYGINPFPNGKILDSFKLKEFADDNFKLDENDRKFLKPVENTVGKGEIARYKQFLLFPQCFQKTCSADT